MLVAVGAVPLSLLIDVSGGPSRWSLVAFSPRFWSSFMLEISRETRYTVIPSVLEPAPVGGLVGPGRRSQIAQPEIRKSTAAS